MIRPLVHIHQKKKIAPEIAAEIACVNGSLNARKVYFTPYPARFTRLCGADMAFKDPKVYFRPYPRFTRLGNSKKAKLYLRLYCFCSNVCFYRK
jgi:hypothetical protein